MAIVRHLVEAHGGIVGADSRGEGQGATFVVRLPLIEQSRTPEKQRREKENSRQSQESSPLARSHILIVDDEVDSLEFLRFVLEQEQAAVTAVNCARKALEKIAQQPPDLLISDIGMPEMDGFNLIQKVRSLPPEQGGQLKSDRAYCLCYRA